MFGFYKRKSQDGSCSYYSRQWVSKISVVGQQINALKDLYDKHHYLKDDFERTNIRSEYKLDRYRHVEIKFRNCWFELTISETQTNKEEAVRCPQPICLRPYLQLYNSEVGTFSLRYDKLDQLYVTDKGLNLTCEEIKELLGHLKEQLLIMNAVVETQQQEYEEKKRAEELQHLTEIALGKELENLFY